VRLLFLSLVALVLAGCGPGAPRLYRGAVSREVMTVIEPKGRSGLVSHVIFAQSQRRSSGDYARLDVRKAVDCDEGRLRMTEVSAYSSSGALINTVSQPGAWTAPEGSEAVELRIVCDRKFAAGRKLHGRLDQLEAHYRTKAAEAS
jgi:hypothetical protein